MSLNGVVLNIERFGIHDGPGIRTVVFLKGCPLRCLWCSTVDSQIKSPEMEYFAGKCLRCKRCLEVCPANAIRESEAGELITDRRHCDGCGKCAEVCPTGARKIAGQKMTLEQVIEEVEKDSMFYSNSGGGLTLSGGEPTMQPEFSLELLKACKARGFHTVMETCGYTKWDVLDPILEYLDLLYMDIKHMSPVEHKRLTLKSNKLILENAQRVAKEHPDKPFIVRIPVIPGYNDTDENISNTAKFVRQLKNGCKIELLPYHKLGIPRYKSLSKNYPLIDLESPSKEHVYALGELVRSHGVQADLPWS